MRTRWSKRKDFFFDWFWDMNPGRLRGWRAVALAFARLAGAVVRDFTGGRLSLWAMSLVYTTLLSLVPFLAISFSVLKGLGVHNQMEPLLLDFFKPMGAEGADIARRILEFVDNVNVGVLGWVGVIFLLYTVIATVAKVERAFNYIWNVASGRGFIRRFSDYLSVLMIWPLLIVASVALTAGMRFEWLSDFDKLGIFPRLIPWIIMTLSFSFVYIFMPNTKVRLLPALAGGMAAAGLWKLLGFMFSFFIMESAAYAAIYSAFAALMLLIIWLYFGWLAVLIGADVSYYLQYPQNQKLQRGHLLLSNRVREKTALAICAAIARQHEAGGDALSPSDLARKLRLPVQAVEEVTQALVTGGILAVTGREADGLMPARSFARVTVFDLLDVLRRAHEKAGIDDDDFNAGTAADAVYARIGKCLKSEFGDVTLDRLAIAGSEKNA